MITLFHSVGARSFRALWALEELQLAYRLEILPFPPREKAPGFLAINPLGTVPLLLDGGTRMTESAMIGHFLAVRAGDDALAVAPGDVDFGAYLNWLSFGEATLTFPQALVLRYSQLEAPERRQPQVAEDYGRWFSGRLKEVDRALAGRTHLCAGRFTMADVSVGYAVLFADITGLSARFSPALRAYGARLRERPGFGRALAAEAQASAEAGVPAEPLRPLGRPHHGPAHA